MSDGDAVIDLSWFRLQTDVAWGRALLTIATMRPEGGAVRPELYLFLGDRYWRLAYRHFVAGRQKQAERLVRKTRFYFRAAGGAEPPPLGAASMPIPHAPSLSSAIGVGQGVGGPDDAA